MSPKKKSAAKKSSRKRSDKNKRSRKRGALPKAQSVTLKPLIDQMRKTRNELAALGTQLAEEVASKIKDLEDELIQDCQTVMTISG